MKKGCSVATVSHYLMPHIGGIEQVVEKQITALLEQGYQVTALATAAHHEKPGTEKLTTGAILHRLEAWTFTERRLAIPFPIVGIRSLRTMWRVIRQADIVHVHDVFYQPCWFATLFAWILGKPLILTQHVAMVQHNSTAVMLLQRLVYALIGTRIFNYSTKIIAYNNRVTSFLHTYAVPAEKIVELRNGIDIKRFHPGDALEKKKIRKKYRLPVDKPLALYLGRLVPKKGYDILYEARDPAFDIVFVGSGDVQATWNESNNVHFLGPRSEEEVAELYRTSDVFVFPADGEVLTLSMQEAMASGLPVITIEDPAYKAHNIDNNRILFVKRTAASLRAAIMRVLKDKSLQCAMSAYSFETAQARFEWRRNIQPLLKLYEKLSGAPKVCVTTSWDDGHRLDTKLAVLLKKYSIAGTFYVAPHSKEIVRCDRLTKDALVNLAADFEIGAHTLSHRHLTSLNKEDARKEVVDSKIYLENILKKPILSFCYPAGKFKRVHQQQVRDAGFILGRTVQRFSYSLGKNPYMLPTTVHTYDHWLDALQVAWFVRFNPVRFLKLYRHWDALAIEQFDHVIRNGGVFHLWGHSWEIEKHGDWKRLERVLDHIGGKSTAAYLTNGELL